MKVLSYRECEYLEGKKFPPPHAKVLKARVKRKVGDMLQTLAFIFEHTATDLDRYSILGVGYHFRAEEIVYKVLRKRQREMDMRLVKALQEALATRKKEK